MSAHLPILPALAADPTDPAEPDANSAQACRHDGWTPKRQHDFLMFLAEGNTVETACSYVGLSVTSAYALRRRVGGEAFALGWRAAVLLARDTLADRLMTRAVEGSIETITRADGSEITRHRHDNKLAMQMLARLDRMVEAAQGPLPVTGPEGMDAARLAAADWGRFIGMIRADGGTPGAALFLTARSQPASPDENAESPQLPQLRDGDGEGQGAPDPAEKGFDESLLWQEYGRGQWYTRFPPPPGYSGRQYGRYGEKDYYRGATPAELAAYMRQRNAVTAALIDRDSAARDAYFGFTPEAPSPSEPPQAQDQARAKPPAAAGGAKDAGRPRAAGGGGHAPRRRPPALDPPPHQDPEAARLTEIILGRLDAISRDQLERAGIAGTAATSAPT